MTFYSSLFDSLDINHVMCTFSNVLKRYLALLPKVTFYSSLFDSLDINRVMCTFSNVLKRYLSIVAKKSDF